MTQIDLLAEDARERPAERGERFELGRGYALYLPRGPRGQADVYHRGGLSKRVNLRDKAERRLLVVELLQQGVNQTPSVPMRTITIGRRAAMPVSSPSSWCW